MSGLLLAAMAGMATLTGAASPDLAAAPQAALAVEPQDYLIGAWELYRSRFVSPEGRVVDDDNGSISHSEGQGYGMLLAVAAGDRANFDKLWSWTQQELFIRDDGLAAWRWDPAASPHITDRNNASDGDMLVAWALLRAAERWNVPEFRKRARAISDALAAHSVSDVRGRKMLMPAAEGFAKGEQPDGPVVNASYWIFPAIAELATISPALAKAKLDESGTWLLRKARFGPAKLPSDWVSLGASDPAPARSFPASFGYNAVRVPLYLAWSQDADPALLKSYADSWSAQGPGALGTVDLPTGATLEPMTAPGYGAIADLVACASGERPARAETRNFVPTTYYPSTLHLLSLLAFAERYPRCL
ncbi:glycosyl hydrolase family 8 [Aureimonas sp. AU40]|uniref:glycosyl hydrolase family 8 n=1 Tax=Aureimonas sp. AU40 TaxID=1637747 RepID=UPI0007852772|nr:glycosyl hydrolase family 8 [Aureimonas sp. AU40]